MKREPSTAGRSLGAISLVITVLTLLIFSTLAYSAYADTNGILKIFGNGSKTPAVMVTRTVQGSSSQVLMNITLSNDGLYPVSIAGSCVSSPGGLNASCSLPRTTVAPGQSKTVQLVIIVNGLSQQNGTAGRPLVADISVALEPFVSLNVTTDLSGLVGQGGA